MNRGEGASLSEALVSAVSKLVDDAQGERRDPSHSTIEHVIGKAGLADADPNLKPGPPVGKAKRVRYALSWAIEHDHEAGGRCVASLVAEVRAVGGFRPTSENYVGEEAIENARSAFATEGYELAPDGDLRPQLLDNLTTIEMTEALRAYVRRAQRGALDAALVAGTGKDLVEAVAAHVLVSLYGTYPTSSNFAALLGQAFSVLGLATPQEPAAPGEAALRAFQRSMFEAACAANRLRNKTGTGHGRPFPPDIAEQDAHAAVQAMGTVAEMLLRALDARLP